MTADARRDRGGVPRVCQEGAPKFFSVSPFDSARFAALTEGLEISIVSFKTARSAASTLRIDPEYFQRRHLADAAVVVAARRALVPLQTLASLLTQVPFTHRSRIHMAKAICHSCA